MPKAWLLYSLMTLLLWGVWGFCYKVACQQFGANLKTPQLTGLFLVQLVASTVLGVLICLSFRAFAVPMEFQKRAIYFTIIGAAVGLFGLLTMIAAMSQGKVSVVVTLTALYPIVTLLLSQWLLRESLTTPQWVGVFLALAALALMAQGK